MVTIESSESLEFAEYLRSQRTMTPAEVIAVEQAHDADDVTAADRWSAIAH